MRILYVHGPSAVTEAVRALYAMDYDVEIYPRRLDKWYLDDDEIDSLADYIRKQEITCLMSIHLIYNLAMAAYKTGIKYAALIWDAPYFRLYTPFAKLDNCYFSTFDKVDCRKFVEYGIPHIIYQPLTVNKEDALRWERENNPGRQDYTNEISFVGSLYDNNGYDSSLNDIPLVLRQYFESVFEEAAFKWDGINRIYGTTSQEMIDAIKMFSPQFKLQHVFDTDDIQYFESFILVRKIANIERVCVLNLLAERYAVTLYTNSQGGVSQLKNVKVMPAVDSENGAPAIFGTSKINLNIALKGIEGGTAQRVIDIMGAGGFVLTNYCPETAELFEEGKEIVMFRSPEELLEKTEYYLKHDKEREEIAKAGHEKVLNCYTYDRKLKELLDWVERKS